MSSEEGIEGSDAIQSWIRQLLNGIGEKNLISSIIFLKFGTSSLFLSQLVEYQLLNRIVLEGNEGVEKEKKRRISKNGDLE